MRAGRIVALVVGCIMALSALGLMAASAVLGIALGTQRDTDGYFTSSTARLETSTYAITSDEVDLGTGPGPRWWSDHDLATVRVRATGAVGDDVFVGIGPAADVTAYLAGVPHISVTDVDFHPFRVEYREQQTGGAAEPAPPGDQAFWAASASGAGEQVLGWEPEPGQWMVVLMRPDATAGVAADVDVGGRIEYLAQVAIGIGVAGVALALLATILIVWSARRLMRPSTDPQSLPPPMPLAPPGLPAPPVAPGEADTPVRLTGHLQPDLNRGLWLVKWFLAIPHFVVLVFLWAAYAVLSIVAFFAIVFTGRYPRGIFDFNVGVLRWTWRVQFYATSAIGTDQYPPFTFDDDATYPASLHVAYPERLSRGLVWVKWLLAIPHLAVVSVLAGSWGFGGWLSDNWFFFGGGLVSILVVIAGVALLFTGRYPDGLFTLVMGFNRWVYRVIPYVSLMTDRYPPFRLDEGADEPHASDPPGGMT